MKPYYSDDFATIYHGDCREVTEWLAADVLVTDPPYGTRYYDTDAPVVGASVVADWVERFVSVAVFGYAETLVEWCGGSRPSEWVTWWPTNAGCRGVNYRGLRREAEHIAVYGPTDGLYDLRQPRSASSARVVASDYSGPRQRGDSNGQVDTRRLGDVWTDAAPGLGFQSHIRRHPNEKPVSVLLKLVGGVSKAPDVIADPFMGSGTTLRAAKDLGRRSIGIEVDERYCEIAAKRLGQEVLDFGGAV